MKRVLLFFIFTVLSITGFAHDFLVDGIYYIKNTDGENTVSVTNYNDQIYSYYEGDVIIPPTVEYEGITYNVTAIRQFAFCRSSELTSVTIPEGVIRIGTYAFGLCPKLTTISIPNSVTEMGSGVFNETPWLENQPDGVLYVGKICYMYKGEMPLNSNIEIKEGTVCIASEAFSNIVVYSVSGKMAGSIKAQGNISCVNTNLKKGEVAIIQVGNKSVKVVMQ